MGRHPDPRTEEREGNAIQFHNFARLLLPISFTLFCRVTRQLLPFLLGSLKHLVTRQQAELKIMITLNSRTLHISSQRHLHLVRSRQIKAREYRKGIEEEPMEFHESQTCNSRCYFMLFAIKICSRHL